MDWTVLKFRIPKLRNQRGTCGASCAIPRQRCRMIRWDFQQGTIRHRKDGHHTGEQQSWPAMWNAEQYSIEGLQPRKKHSRNSRPRSNLLLARAWQSTCKGWTTDQVSSGRQQVNLPTSLKSPWRGQPQSHQGASSPTAIPCERKRSRG